MSTIWRAAKIRGKSVTLQQEGNPEDKPSIERVRVLTHLAGSALDDDVTVLSESRALLFEKQCGKKVRQHALAKVLQCSASQPASTVICMGCFRLVRLCATRWNQQ